MTAVSNRSRRFLADSLFLCSASFIVSTERSPTAGPMTALDAS